MKKIALLSLVLLLALPSGAQSPIFPFMDSSKPREERIDDLISRLTLEEKVAMMQNGSKGVERLGIPDYNWWNEALHGVARAGLATVFPQAIGLAATFDPEEQFKTFSIVSDEARAKYHQSIRDGNNRQYYGLSFWTPNINIFRDPRWGRGQETYGEDPYLTSVMGVATVKGLQGNDPDYLKTHACAKHFAVHSGPEWNRHQYDARVSQRDLWETYLPAFKALVTEGNVQEVMGAYNRYEGSPCCASDRLLVQILRDRWNYQGLVVSDCGAIDDFYVKGRHETYENGVEAASVAVNTGTDLECGGSYRFLVQAVQEGQIEEKAIDLALRRILKGRFDLGMFDPDEKVPYSNIPYSSVDSEEHAAQALKMARKSIVLLKNNGVLPVRPENVSKIAVVGPNADDETMQLGNYNGFPSSIVTILDGIKAAYPSAEVTYERGCDLVQGFVRGKDVSPIPDDLCTPKALKAVAQRAAEADVIFFVGGLSPNLEGEEFRLEIKGFKGGDRETIELPDIQGDMLSALHSTGKPVVFIMCTGSAIGLKANEENYDALINAWYGGQAGGTAVADVISGKYNPSGKLPITFYQGTEQLPDFLSYDMEGRTYRYMKEEPLYPFGYGLSYTNYVYGKPKLSNAKKALGENVEVSVRVANRGRFAGEETVEVYVSRLNDPQAPNKALKGISKVQLKPGESKNVKVVLTPQAFEYYSSSADDLSEKTGNYVVSVGPSSQDKDLQGIELVIY